MAFMHACQHGGAFIRAEGASGEDPFPAAKPALMPELTAEPKQGAAGKGSSSHPSKSQVLAMPTLEA